MADLIKSLSANLSSSEEELAGIFIRVSHTNQNHITEKFICRKFASSSAGKWQLAPNSVIIAHTRHHHQQHCHRSLSAASP